MNISYSNSITANEVNFIRASIGFRQIHPEQINSGLDGSIVIVAAHDHDKVVGMSRLIWDGGTVALIQDVLVIPEYQLQGIETEMITRIVAFLCTKQPGFGIQVDVKAWNNQNKSMKLLDFKFRHLNGVVFRCISV